jgi:serine/threonine protein kinase
MFFGKIEVAVKIYYLDSERHFNEFKNECSINKTLSYSGGCPKIYHYDIIENIGFIIMNLEIPLNKIHKIAHTNLNHRGKYWNKHNEIDVSYKDIIFAFLGQFKTYYIDFKNTETYKKMNTFIKLKELDVNKFKLNVISGLKLCLTNLQNNNIIHRDLHYDNIVLSLFEDNLRWLLFLARSMYLPLQLVKMGRVCRLQPQRG